jgi:hypothetical protein
MHGHNSHTIQLTFTVFFLHLTTLVEASSSQQSSTVSHITQKFYLPFRSAPMPSDELHFLESVEVDPRIVQIQRLVESESDTTSNEAEVKKTYHLSGLHTFKLLQLIVKAFDKNSYLKYHMRYELFEVVNSSKMSSAAFKLACDKFVYDGYMPGAVGARTSTGNLLIRLLRTAPGTTYIPISKVPTTVTVTRENVHKVMHELVHGKARSISALIFGDDTLNPAQGFTNTTVGTSISINPFVSITQLSPSYEFREY